MPTYEYECSNGHNFEVVQRITEKPLQRCTICGAKAHRLISAAPFILKGGGWYQDGYSSSARSGGNGSAGSGDGARGKSADGSGQSSASDSSSDSSSSSAKSSSSGPSSGKS